MTRAVTVLGTVTLAAFAALPGGALGAQDTFSFSKAEEKERQSAQQTEDKRAAEMQALVSVPCRSRLKNRKILQLVGEYSADEWLTDQFRFTSLFEIIDARLRALGLRTFTQEEIRKQVARAELDAYFKNDPDAALAASSRFGAEFILRGEISTRSGVNRVVGVNQVAVDIRLTLTTAGGRVLSQVDSHGDSYAGHDLVAAATDLVRTQADQLVSRLYNDYCRQGR